MRNILILLSLMLGVIQIVCFADQFVPEFDKMQIMRCDYNETIFDNDGSEVSTSHQHKLFRIDDPYKKIYDQKEPIDHIIIFDNNKIEYTTQSMSDDFISRAHVVIDRAEGKFTSDAQITYDNEIYGTRYSKSSGSCEILE